MNRAFKYLCSINKCARREKITESCFSDHFALLLFCDVSTLFCRVFILLKFTNQDSDRRVMPVSEKSLHLIEIQRARTRLRYTFKNSIRISNRCFLGDIITGQSFNLNLTLHNGLTTNDEQKVMCIVINKGRFLSELKRYVIKQSRYL